MPVSFRFAHSRVFSRILTTPAQPKSELRQRLESTGATLFYLRAITITLRPNETLVTSMDGKSVTLQQNSRDNVSR
ncbi:MAG TPA: hypothetical protein VF773_17130 [Verrucomicrobiae bacterium]